MAETIVLKGRTFNIKNLSARDGSWVLNEALSKKMPFDLSQMIPAGDNPSLTEAEFHAVQDRVLAYVTETVQVRGNDGEMLPHEKPIMVGGRLIPTLESELYIVSQLTSSAIVVNIAPFFIDREADSKEPQPTNP